MKIDINHIAKLARLKIPEEKFQRFEKDMSNILDMVEKLPEMDMGDMELDPSNTMQLREDVAVPKKLREEILQNAPQTEAGCIVVPKIVE